MSTPAPVFGGGGVDPGPRPPTLSPTNIPTVRPTRSPVKFGSGGIDPGPRPPTPSPTISSEPSALPTVSPYPTTIITFHPTPSQDFPYRPEGDSAFGHRWYDFYYDAYQHALRRFPGWSWGQYSTGPGPFCYRNTCYNVSSVCPEMDGILLHPSVCSFTPDVIVAGPSCWRGLCNSNGTQACTSLGGVTVGAADGTGGPQWCVVDGARSLVGPTCYGTDCFDVQEPCEAQGGVIWNDDFCFLNGYFTTIGPVCWNGYCQTNDLAIKCSDLQGTVFADRWCVIPGCDKTVIGPTCSMVPSQTQQCFTDRMTEVCNEIGGINVGNRFCVADSTEWTLVGPVAYYQNETRAATSNFCAQLRQPQLEAATTDAATSDANTAAVTASQAYFSSMEAYDIEGVFCLVKQPIPTTTPFCAGSSVTEGVGTACDLALGRKFCERFGGKVVADGFMCSLCDSFAQVVGPMVWNGTFLKGDPKYCEGPFCAIPNLDINNGVNINLRCPSAVPVPNRCEAFGGAIGFGADDDTNSTNSTDDDDPNVASIKSSARTVRRGHWSSLGFMASFFLLAGWTYC
ncbi:hypothetical protein ACA910_021222 [Epithemia clementina (nom. ined.)]